MKKVLTLGPWVTTWIEKHLVHGPGDVFGRPVRLTDEQKTMLARFYALGPDGSRKHRRVVVGRAKGWGKSETAAMVACAELAGPVRFGGWDGSNPIPVSVRSPDIPVAAASFEQADLVFGTARTMLSEGPLAPFVEAFDTEIQLKDRPGRMYRVAAVAGTNDGLRPSFFVADETHEWRDRRRRLHLVLWNGLGKRHESWALEITTAGFQGDGSIAEDAYQYGMKIRSGEIEDSEFLFDWKEASADLDLDDPTDRRTAVLEANPNAERFGIINQVLSRFNQIPVYEWVRYFGNAWTASEDQWISETAWTPLKVKDRELTAADEVVVGFSASGPDSAALMGCTADGYVFHIAHWEPLPGVKGYQVPASEVDAKVAWCFIEAPFTVRELHCYPLVWQPEYDEWIDLYGEHRVSESPVQSNRRIAEACGRFYRAVGENELAHDGNLVVLRHLLNATVAVSNYGTYITHRNASGPMDLARAGVLAYERAMTVSEEVVPVVTFI